MAETTLSSVEAEDSLGTGCCGEVFAASVSGFAIKRYNSMAVDRAFLARNFGKLMEMPAHEGVNRVLDFRFDSPPYEVLMERIDGETLSSHPSWKEAEIWTVIRKCADALGHAHKYGAYHGHLHPANLRLRTDSKKSPSPVLTDFGTGLIGEIHHINPGESIFFSAPEQIESGGSDWTEGKAAKWDVYSFGVLAFWLINERHPRGLRYMKQRGKEEDQSGGRPVPIDAAAFLDDIFESPKYSWGMSFGRSREFKLYREIVDECLSLDVAKRPVDMREVRNRFRALDHLFAMENAEERVVKERRKQRAKLFGARALAVCLGVSFLGATYYLVDYLKKTYFFQNKVTELDQVVLTQKATITHLDERWAETVTDLKKSREAADSFFQKMAHGDLGGGSGVSALGKEELEKSREYYLKTLEKVSEEGESSLERARAMHSLAHIERKLGMSGKAISHFQEAISALDSVLAAGKVDESAVEDIYLRLADSHESISALLPNPIGKESLAALENAVNHFEKLLDQDPGDLAIVMRQAGTSYKLGRAYDAHREYEKAIGAYSSSAEHAMSLRENSPENESLTELIGKLQFSAASSLANAGRLEEAINAHVASMETLEELRNVNGFSPLQSIQLASSFLELGGLFSKLNATAEDMDQLYNEALRLLTPLNTENPRDMEVATLLCRCLSRLGQLERSEGRWSAGYQLSTRGIEALKEALGEKPSSVEGLLALAEIRLEHLSLLETEKEAALKIAGKGVETANEAKTVLEKGVSIQEPIRSQMNERLAALFLKYGKVCRDLGDEKTATACFRNAEIQLAQRNVDETGSLQ
jgi:tetratricopeptide (TPR) repeat protein